MPRDCESGAAPCFEGWKPLCGGFHFGRFGCVIQIRAGAGAVERADGVGFAFDDELFDDVVRGFLPGLDRDRSIVFAGGEFALYQDMGAFGEAGFHVGEPFAESHYVVPLGAFFPLPVFVLPGGLGGDRELGDGGAVGEELGFGVFAEAR